MTHEESRVESIDLDAQLLNALNHKIRRKILLDLYEHGLGGYSELSSTLHLKSGVFYHHMRLLLDADLVHQLEDKTYDITPKGVRTLKFLQTSSFPIQDDIGRVFELYTPLFNTIEAFPPVSILILLFFSLIGLFWVSMTQDIGLLGYFVFSSDQSLLRLSLSVGSFLFDTIILYSYFIVILKRPRQKSALIAHTLFPRTLVVLVLVILSFLPAFPFIWSLTPVLSFCLMFLFQGFSTTYYLHLLRKNGLKSLEKGVIGILSLQYWNLLVLFLVT